MNKTAARFAPIMLIVASSLIALLALEVGYRLWAYHSIKNQLLEVVSAQYPRTPGGTSVYDPVTGYRYRPNLDIEKLDGPFPIHWTTNSHGLIARSDFPVEKPSGEFRIGLIGDSFVANVTDSLRWGDVMEDALNESSVWREAVKDQKTHVINFGMDGISANQFGGVASQMASKYGLDLVIVNIIRPDVARRPYYRGSSNELSEAEFSRIILSRSVDRLDWFGPYPDAIAAAGGSRLGMEQRLTLNKAAAFLNGPRHYANMDEAAAASVASAREILKLFPDAIWIIHPVYQDYVGYEGSTDPDAPMFNKSFDAFEKMMPEIHFVNMIDRVQKPPTRAELDTWFNVPADQHNSNKGLTIYGNAVAQMLIERSGPRKHARLN